MNAKMVVGAIIVIVIIVAAGAYFVMNQGSTGQAAPNSTSTVQATTAPVTSVMQSNTTAASTSATTSVMPTTTAANTSYSVNVWYNSSVGGNYLTNSTGWTLYLYTPDTPYSGNSTCYGSCATYWPPFYAANLTVAPGVNASAFNTITRTGGAKQLTYEGWPLYFYAGDKAAGSTKGQGVGGIWYVLNVPTLQKT